MIKRTSVVLVVAMWLSSAYAQSGPATGGPNDTGIAVSHTRTATLTNWKNAEGQIIPAPPGWSMSGVSVTHDGGLLVPDKRPNSVNFTVTGNQAFSDYTPPRPMQFTVTATTTSGPVNVTGYVTPLAPTPAPPTDLVPVTAQVVWGPEK